MASITHIVLVAWKVGQQAQAEATIRSSIRGFSGTIPGVQSVVEGHSSSPEGLDEGFDYGFVVSLVDARARNAYLDDPRHRPVAEVINAAASRIAVFDI